MTDSILSPGMQLPDGSTVDRLLASEAAFEHYVARHPEFGQVLAHVVRPSGADAWLALDDVLGVLGAVNVENLEQHLGRGAVAGTRYLLTRAILGRPLPRWVAEEGAQAPLDTLRMVRQAGDVLRALHDFAPHGALSELDFVIDRSRRLWVTGAGYRRVSLCSSGSDVAPFSSMASLAPEVIADPWDASEASDYFGLGYLMVSLLGGRCPDRASIGPQLDALAESQHPAMIGMIEALLEPSAALRISSADELDQRIDATMELLEPGASRAPAFDPFAGLDLPPALAGGEDGEPERWIVRKDGRDWGPFSVSAVLAQLHADEIDETTPILDTETRALAPLGQVDEFVQAVKDYLPIRLDKEMARQERRDEVVRGVKRTSTTAVLATILGVVSLGYIGYLNASMVTPMNFSEVSGSFGHVVPAPQIEYQGIAADEQLLAALFDFSDPTPEEEAARPGIRRRRPAADGSPGPGPGDDDYIPDDGGDYVVDFSSDAPTTTLTSDQINAAVGENLYRVRDCYADEMSSNSGFRGVVAAWSIRPDGRVFNARVADAGGGSNRVQTCVTRAIRGIRFAPFNNVPMNVRFPFRMN
jgi:hypothetical protein